MPSAVVRRIPIEDPTVYPSTDDMGEPTLQISISVLLLALIHRWLVSRGKPAFVGMNTFFYWKPFVSTECLAPDVYVLPGVPLSARPPSWKIWETGKAPSFALEVVSQDVDKDYLLVPPKYDRMGVAELVVFDPAFRVSNERVQWQVFRRIKGRGLVRVEATNGDRVRSRVLGCFLRAVGDGAEVRLRLGTGPAGDVLVPTDEEERDEERAARVQERAARVQAEAARDEERAARVQERAAREQAEVERERAKAEREQAKAERDEERAAREQERAARERVEAELAALRATVAGRARRKAPAAKR